MEAPNLTIVPQEQGISTAINPDMKTFGALYIDPPWRFEVWSRMTGLDRSAESHYPTMTPDKLKALPIPTLMADDCAVFMWATWPTLPQAVALGECWGLTYKTCAFLWAKMNKHMNGRFAVPEDNANWHMGMGFWTRANTEPCLLFTKGKPKRKAANVRQLIVSPIERHSKKPDSVYASIEALVNGPYCELFARQTKTGWDSWGNEIDSTIELEETNQ